MRDTFQASVPLEAAKASTDGRIMKGYAAVFGRPAIEGEHYGAKNLIVTPKAFDKTLKERQGKIKVLFQHGRDPFIGHFPLGVPQVMRADAYGLWTETLLDETDFNTGRLIPALRSGAIDGMSLTAEIIRDEFSDDGETRYFHELALREFGPVTFPLFEDTTALAASKRLEERLESPAEVRAEASVPPGRQDDATRERDRLTRTADSTLTAQRERFQRLFGGEDES